MQSVMLPFTETKTTIGAGRFKLRRKEIPLRLKIRGKLGDISLRMITYIPQTKITANLGLKIDDNKKKRNRWITEKLEIGLSWCQVVCFSFWGLFLWY